MHGWSGVAAAALPPLFVFRVFSFFVFGVFCFCSVGDSLSDLGELGGNLFLFVFRVFSFFVFVFFLVFLVWGIP